MSKNKRVAVLLDYENIACGVEQSGRLVNWERLIEYLADFGNLVAFKVFMPFHSIPGNINGIQSILAALPYAETIFTTEGLADENITDDHINQVAIAMLGDKKAAPDILVIGSGDHFFAPLADLYEAQGKRVVILSCNSNTTSHMLIKEDRTVSFLTDGDGRFLFSPKSQEISEGEFRVLSRLITWPRRKVEKRNKVFQMVSIAYDLAKQERSFTFADLRKKLMAKHKTAVGISMTNHSNDSQYTYAIRLLLGDYLDIANVTAAVGRMPGSNSLYFREGSDLGERIERIQSSKK